MVNIHAMYGHAGKYQTVTARVFGIYMAITGHIYLGQPEQLRATSIMWNNSTWIRSVWASPHCLAAREVEVMMSSCF